VKTSADEMKEKEQKRMAYQTKLRNSLRFQMIAKEAQSIFEAKHEKGQAIEKVDQIRANYFKEIDLGRKIINADKANY